MARKARVTAPEGSDRRVRRTRRRLKEALLALIESRGWETVTVEEIAERADVGRSTFYSHFDSKEDLLFSGFDSWLLSLAETAKPLTPGGAGFAFSLPLLQHMRGHGPFLKALFLGSDGRLRRRTNELIVEVVRRELAQAPPRQSGSRVSRKGSPDAAQEREAHAQAVAGAFVGLVAWWLEQGSAFSPEAVDRIFQRSIASRA